jgi:catechol 2,3-dioxygenase-like lactoylglutathione lyase family enzyme
MNAPRAFEPVLTGFDHVTIAVADIAVAERFYVHVLGGERVRRTRAVEIWFGTRPFLELALATATSHDAHARVSFTVRPDDLIRMRDDLRARGIPSHGPHKDGAPGRASLDFLDPFGNALEVVTSGFRGEIVAEPQTFAELHYAWNEVDLSPRTTPDPGATRARPSRAARVSSRRLIQ